MTWEERKREFYIRLLQHGLELLPELSNDPLLLEAIEAAKYGDKKTLKSVERKLQRRVEYTPSGQIFRGFINILAQVKKGRTRQLSSALGVAFCECQYLLNEQGEMDAPSKAFGAESEFVGKLMHEIMDEPEVVSITKD